MSLTRFFDNRTRLTLRLRLCYLDRITTSEGRQQVFLKQEISSRFSASALQMANSGNKGSRKEAGWLHGAKTGRSLAKSSQSPEISSRSGLRFFQNCSKSENCPAICLIPAYTKSGRPDLRQPYFDILIISKSRKPATQTYQDVRSAVVEPLFTYDFTK